MLYRSAIEQKVVAMAFDCIDLPQSRLKHFSFLVRRNRILNMSVNHSRKSHPFCKKHNYRYSSMHSEVKMLLDTKFIYGEDYNKLKVYNVRINKLGAVANSKPCVNCEAVLRLAGFRSIYYTTDEGNFNRLELNNVF